MGEVYLAHDSKLNRKVALKFLSKELDQKADFRKRFTREAQAAAKLNHPNIVTVHEVGEFEKRPYIAMSYVKGDSLSHLKDLRKFSIPEIIDIGIQIAEGLSVAHGNGITHRDLKPANIIIEEKGKVQILDFGLAISQDASDVESTLSKLTDIGAVAGTVPYMSPEQLKGQPVDHLTDIFALGVILYELVSGDRPFGGKSAAEISSSILRDQPRLISEIRIDIPYDLERIIGRCLQKDPNRRIQSALDVKNELLELQSADFREAPDLSRKKNSDRNKTEVLESQFILTAELVRQLENRLPQMVGGELTYTYNTVESDTLVIYLAPWGLEPLASADEVLAGLPCRAVAPIIYGWNSDAKFRPALSVDDHSTILRSFFKHRLENFGSKRVVIVGFSSSADHISRMITSPVGIGVPLDGAIIIGCNLDISTCFVSSVFAEMDTSTESGILESINKVGKTASSIHDWILTQNYLLAIVQKFGKNMEPVKRFARDIVEPFKVKDSDQFPKWYRAVIDKVPVVQFVFSTDDSPALDRILKRHLEENILGDNYSEKTIGRMELAHIQTGHPNVVIELVKKFLAKFGKS